MDLTIGIVSVYFGKLPDYFPVWLESCRKNPTVDFFVVTDQAVTSDIPNVKLIASTLNELKVQASAVLGFDVVLDSPFKLCDFKPAYGMIFEELLTPYDYWGHCDLDLIWGDLRSFFEEYHLDRFDKFLPLGHLSLYRNTPENNRRFMNEVEGLSNYREIFQKKENYLFDELALIRIYKNNYPFFDKIIFADIWPSRKRYTMCTDLKYYPSIYKEFSERCKPINFRYQIFMWMDGKIYQYYASDNGIKSREYIYIHIQKRKWKLAGSFSTNMVISQNSVIPVETEDLDIPRLIEKYNPYNWLADMTDDVYEFLRHCWSYFKRKVIKVEANRIVVEQ